MSNFSLPSCIYSFVLVRGSSNRRALFKKKCNNIFEPNISITETRRTLFLTFARKATQDLRQTLKEKQRHRRYLNDLNPLDVKACISHWEKPTKFNPTLTVHRYLRNRKHVLCFYRVIQTRVEVWENEKCCGNTSRRWVFPQLFRVLPNFHECLYNSIETRSTCFLFLLENNAKRKRKTTC